MQLNATAPRIQSRQVAGRPGPRLDRSATGASQTDQVQMSAESQKRSARSRMDAAWKKFYKPNVLRNSLMDRKEYPQFEKRAHSAARESGHPKGSRAYRDAYRRSMVQQFKNRYLVRLDYTGRMPKHDFGGAARKTSPHIRRFQEADQELQRLSRPQPKVRSQPRLRPQTDSKKVIDGMMKWFQEEVGSGLSGESKGL